MADDGESDDAEPPKAKAKRSKEDSPPPVWGIWKKQPLGASDLSVVEREAAARSVLEQHRGLIGLFLRRTKLPAHAVFTYEDLRSVFEAVLLQAHASYDPAFETAFSTWASIWLKQAAMEIVRRVSGRTRTEQMAYLQALRVRRWQCAVAAGRAEGEAPGGLSDRQKTALEAHAVRGFVSLSAISGGRPLEEVLHSSHNAPIDDQLHQTRVHAWLRKKLSNGILSGRERAVLQGYLRGETFREIGEALGVSRQAAQMFHASALRKLRKAASRDRIDL